MCSVGTGEAQGLAGGFLASPPAANMAVNGFFLAPEAAPANVDAGTRISLHSSLRLDLVDLLNVPDILEDEDEVVLMDRKDEAWPPVWLFCSPKFAVDLVARVGGRQRAAKLDKSLPLDLRATFSPLLRHSAMAGVERHPLKDSRVFLR